MLWRLCIFCVFFSYSQFALACSVDTSGPMPVCSFPNVANPDRVVLIEAEYPINATDLVVETINQDNSSPPWSSFVSHAFIDIKNLNDKATLVLSSEFPIVFEVSGEVDQIQSVIVLGSKRGGPGAVGVYGVNSKTVEFVPVDGIDQNVRSDCSAPPASCDFRQFMRESESDSDSLFLINDEVFSNYQNRIQAISSETDEGGVGTYVISEDENGVSIETIFPERKFEEGIDFGYYNHFLQFDLKLHSEIDVNEVTFFDGITKGYFYPRFKPITYKTTWKESDLLPRWHGMKQLQAQGKILLPDDPGFLSQAVGFKGIFPIKENRTPVIIIEDITEFPKGMENRFTAYVKDGVSVPCMRSHCYSKHYVFENIHYDQD